MINAFKPNSRFEVLNEKPEESIKDIIKRNINIKYNPQKLDNNIEKDVNPFKINVRPRETFTERYNRKRDEQLKEQQAEKERLELEALSINSFPELTTKIELDNHYKVNIPTYIDKLNTQKEVKEVKEAIDSDLVNLQPGWLRIKKDKQTGNTSVTCGLESDNYKPQQKTECEIGLDTLNALAKLHEKKTNEYIELYGYDEWESTFKFPDWREREAYLEVMEELQDETDDSDYDEENAYISN